MDIVCHIDHSLKRLILNNLICIQIEFNVNLCTHNVITLLQTGIDRMMASMHLCVYVSASVNGSKIEKPRVRVREEEKRKT